MEKAGILDGLVGKDLTDLPCLWHLEASKREVWGQREGGQARSCRDLEAQLMLFPPLGASV